MTTTKLLAAAFALLTTAGLTVAFADPPERERERPRDGERERAPRDGDRERAPRDGDRERAPRDGDRERAPRDGDRDRAPRDGDRDGPPPRGDRPVFPLLKALDKNGDGVIDSGEIERAVAALKSLDKNSDGKLTREELMPNFAGMRRGEGGERPGPGDDRGRRPGGEGAQQRGNPGEMFSRMDRNGDGSLSEDEVPEQMRAKFSMVDTNEDGSVSKEELVSAIERRMKQGAAGGNKRGGDRDAAEGGEKPRRPPLKKDKDREKV